MPILVTCPSCNHASNAPDSFAGKRLRCKRCAASVDIPVVATVADMGLDLAALGLDGPSLITMDQAEPEVEPVQASAFVPTAVAVALPKVVADVDKPPIVASTIVSRRHPGTAQVLLYLIAWLSIPICVFATYGNIVEQAARHRQVLTAEYLGDNSKVVELQKRMESADETLATDNRVRCICCVVAIAGLACSRPPRT